MRLLKKLVVVIGAVVAVSVSGWLISRKLVEIASPLPDNLGVNDGKLAPCPETPNCVSTQANDPEHRLEPIPFTAPVNEVRSTLAEILGSLPRTYIATISSNYIHGVSRSRVFGFIDDTEIYIDEESNLIHIRAAARLGQGDFGVNRERAEEISAKFRQLSQ